MNPLRTAVSIIVVLAVACAFLVPGAANAQITLTETGFDVTNLGSSVGAKGVECSPGGIWGDYVYVGDSAGDAVERITYADVVSLFTLLPVSSFPVGMTFGPGPASNFGNFLYIANYGTSKVDRIDTAGTVTPFITITQPSDVAFDPTGAYGTDMFVATGYAPPIYKVDQFGTPTIWATFPSLYIKFGPGGAFGTGMYATSQTAVGIVKVDMAGVPTNFCTGFTNPEGFDWGFGPGFGGDMFASDVSTGQIWRVDSTGTRTLWATMPSAADITFCNGSLYVVGYHTGECYKITPEEPVAVTFSSVRALAEDDRVRVTWDVFADEEIDGFVVYREDVDARTAFTSELLAVDRREYVDNAVVPGSSYRYVVGAQMPDGREIVSRPATVSVASVALTMSQNYPNPFNPTTTIEYSLPESAPVTLSIYDGKGRLVVDLASGTRPVGKHTVTWDGRDAQGATVASGIYFYRLTTGNQTLTRKLVLLK